MEKNKTIVQKTDQVVKTTESWWAFGSLIYNAGWLLTGVAAIASVMTAAIVSIFTAISQYGWAGWFLASIPAFFITLLLWLMAAWLLSKRPRKVFEDQSKYVRVEEFEKLEEAVKNLTSRDSGIDDLGNRVDAVNSRLDDLKHRMAINFGAVAEMHDAQAELRYFEPLTEELEVAAQKLAEIPLSDTWHSEYANWLNKFNHWVTFPQKYHPDKYEKLTDIDLNLLKSVNWTDKVNSISNPDDLLEYKKFKILYRNFEDNREAAHAIIKYKAWNTFSGQGTSSQYVNRFKF